MACSLFNWTSFALVLLHVLLHPQSLESRPVHFQEQTTAFKPPTEESLAEFNAWVARVGEKAKINANSKTEATETVSEEVVLTDSYAYSAYIVVDQTGKGQFYTVQDAVNSIIKDAKRTQRITIQINAGTYQEKVLIPKNVPYLTLQGAGREVTTIVHAETKGEAGTDIADATVAISAPNFIARDITFQNSAPAPAPGSVGKQATALYISGDMGAFYNCGFLGAQDTLYDHSGRHYFETCFIQGSIDFIYGNGLSLYKKCTLHVIATSSGSLTAQKRMSTTDNTGFSFVQCTVNGGGQILLGRAWGTYSRVVFAQTYMADIIAPSGWYNWGDPTREASVFYGEYECYGPGANPAGRVSWSRQLTYTEAAPFLTVNYIDGQNWLQNWLT